MTLPGLALFYAGLVNSKNVVSVLMQHFALACVVSVLWVILGYSLAFSEGNEWIGGFSNIFMSAMSSIQIKIFGQLFITFDGCFFFFAIVSLRSRIMSLAFSCLLPRLNS